MAEPPQVAPDPRRHPLRMQDVAAEAGVSKSTVSRVLGGIDSGIPEATRERVLAIAAAMGYRPNAIASGLRRQTSDTIGFISDVIASTPHAGAMVQGAQDAAWRAGKVLMLVNTGGDPEVEHKAIDTMLQRQVDGLIYATMYHQVVEPPQELHTVPCVLLDARSSTDPISSVVPDEAGGAAVAVRALADAGHTRIGFLNSAAGVPAAAERYAGYQAELTRHGLATGDHLVEADTDEFEGGLAAAGRLLDLEDPPTALFCFNDRMAAGAIRAARERGLRVPDDLSVVGFDNEELVALLTDPPLTTVQLPHYEMGRWAVDQVLAAMNGPEAVTRHRAACTLVERASVAPPPGSAR